MTPLLLVKYVGSKNSIEQLIQMIKPISGRFQCKSIYIYIYILYMFIFFYELLPVQTKVGLEHLNASSHMGYESD